MQILFKTLILVGVLVTPTTYCLGQDSIDSRVSIGASIGVSYRSQPRNDYDLKPTFRSFQAGRAPYFDEDNVRGLSLNPGVSVSIKNLQFEYVPNLRYDETYINRKTFLYDHNLSFTCYKRFGFGVNWSLINTGKIIEYVTSAGKNELDLQFSAFGVHFNFDVFSLVSVEPKIQYAPFGTPEYIGGSFLFSIRLFYRFREFYLF